MADEKIADGVADDVPAHCLVFKPYLFSKRLFFGTIGTGINNTFYAGRDATHEIGRWLNLYSIGLRAMGVCPDDSVADTPPVDSVSNSYCPSFPFNANNSRGSDSNGVMFMNYMSYTDGDCENMLTNGQIARMRAYLNTTRSSLLTSDGCTPVGINEWTDKMNIKLFPNPTP